MDERRDAPAMSLQPGGDNVHGGTSSPGAAAPAGPGGSGPMTQLQGPPSEDRDRGLRTSDAGPRAAAAVDFPAAVAKFETPLLRYAAQILGPGAEAEDVVQETFLRLHRRLRRRGPTSVRNVPTWLFRVAHNRALDVARERDRRRRRTRAAAAAPVEAPATLEGLDDLVRREAAERALAETRRLPDDMRHVLLLKTIQGLTLREISKVTGLSLGNVDYKVNQALRELARRLKAAGVL